MSEALDNFVAGLLTADHWPFWAAAAVFAIVGQFSSLALFTKERAYQKGFWQPVWWWGRESLPLQPILAGVLLGGFWLDPEGRHWTPVASSAYFAFAGAVSLVLWVIAKGAAKKRGIDLTLPGQSPLPPPPKDKA